MVMPLIFIPFMIATTFGSRRRPQVMRAYGEKSRILMTLEAIAAGARWRQDRHGNVIKPSYWYSIIAP
jgi:hypothetical protein